jgi:diguanylate cyclase (GGDEF)-like protein
MAYVGLMRAAQRRLEDMATRDPLTRLSNRRHFWAQAEQRAAQGPGGEPMVLLLVDVDHFKSINDMHGHAVGDEVLVGVAECLRACCRDHDVVARWGGEEFLLLLTRTDLAGGLVVAERIRGSIASQRLAASQPELSVTVSLGATQAQEGEALNAGIARADTALYRSKKAGRDRVTAV